MFSREIFKVSFTNTGQKWKNLIKLSCRCISKYQSMCSSHNQELHFTLFLSVLNNVCIKTTPFYFFFFKNLYLKTCKRFDQTSTAHMQNIAYIILMETPDWDQNWSVKRLITIRLDYWLLEVKQKCHDINGKKTHLTWARWMTCYASVTSKQILLGHVTSCLQLQTWLKSEAH